MKKINLKTLLLSISLLAFTGSINADASAERKNKCKNGKHFKQTVQVKGGTSNCGNISLGTSWHCNNTFGPPSYVSAWKGNTNCSCGSTQLAAEAWAHSNASIQSAWSAVYSFNCGWPNKWKAGTASLHQAFNTPAPMVLTTMPPPPDVEYVMSARVTAAAELWDYVNDRVSLVNLSASLKKYTPDMTNDYSTFIIEVAKVTGETADGGEIKHIIYSCRATIYDGNLLVQDASGSITSGDFTATNVGAYGKQFDISTTTKTLRLSEDVSEDDELNVTFYVDNGNYAEGGRFALDPTSVEDLNAQISASQAVSLDVLSNPVMSQDIEFQVAVKGANPGQSYQFLLRDVTGKVAP